MKIIVNTIRVYKFEELNEIAKENVKEWYLNDYIRSEDFYNMIEEDLNNLFPNSDLKVCFSLASCQGDGLNVYGTINFNDFLEIDKNTDSNIFSSYTAKEINRLKFYFNYFNEYTFEENDRYCYSCKFIDKKYENETVTEFCNELRENGIRNIDIYLIDKFFSDLLEWFSDYDRSMEKAGYEYLYSIDDEEMQEICDINDYMFLESGEFYS